MCSSPLQLILSCCTSIGMAAFVPLSLIPAAVTTIPHSASTGAASPLARAPWPGVSSPPPLRADSNSIDTRQKGIASRYTSQQSVHPASLQMAEGSSLQVLTATRAPSSHSRLGQPDAQLPAVDASLAADSMLVYPDGALGAFAGAAFDLPQQATPTAGGAAGTHSNAGSPERGLLLPSPTAVRDVNAHGSRDHAADARIPAPSSPAGQPDTSAVARPDESSEHDVAAAAAIEPPATVPGLADEPAHVQLPPPPPDHGLYFYTAPEVARIADAIRDGSPLHRGQALTSASPTFMSRCAAALLALLPVSLPDMTCCLAVQRMLMHRRHTNYSRQKCILEGWCSELVWRQGGMMETLAV